MSTQGIVTVVVSFRELEERIKFYQNKTVRQLIVIFIATMVGVSRFEEVLRCKHGINPVWLVMFPSDSEKGICNYCKKPWGNWFHLRFNSEMLVSCCYSNLIDEWWSQEKNTTSTASMGLWVDESKRIQWFPNGSLYSRRRSINKRELRIAIVRVN